MSTGKIGENETSPTSTPAQESSGHTSDNEEKSTEAQLLELRRSSTQARQPSRLSEATPVEQSHSMLPDQEVTEESQGAEPQDKTAVETQEPEFGASLVPEDPTISAARTQSRTSAGEEGASVSTAPPERRESFHRGSSVEEADIYAIRKAEADIRIQEEDEDEDTPAKDEGVEAEARGMRQRASVGIGKDTVSDEPVNEDPVFSQGEPTKEAKQGEDAHGKEQVRDLDASKDEKMKDADVKLPTGREKDVEGEDTSMKPQETKAAEVEDASVSVGD